MAKEAFRTFIADLVQSFRWPNLSWHLSAIALTYGLVTSGFDWRYFELTRNALLVSIGFSAALLGFLVPIVLPAALYVLGRLRDSVPLKTAARVLIQAAASGWLVSALYKTFTGRLQPELITHVSTLDISRDFNFGFFRHGIFWGWPSSHTAVAFAMAAALVARYPRHRALTAAALLYALYIGLGVSVTIHWFSDFAAGALIGTAVGLAVGKRGYESPPSIR